jgi:tetratricopeptide (TPR) repeat protein
LKNCLAGLALLHLAVAASAAPGFITGARVTRDAFMAEVTVSFACGVEYVDHMPSNRGDRLRIQLEPTGVCQDASPSIAESREQHRPLAADDAKLVQIDYDGDSASGATLSLEFSEVVGFDVLHRSYANEMTVRVYLDAPVAAAEPSSGASGTRVEAEPEPQRKYSINLSSSRRSHAASDMPVIAPAPGLEVFESQVVIAGVTWYRLRLGFFTSTEEATAELAKYREQYPTAWIDRAKNDAAVAADSSRKTADAVASVYPSDAASIAIGLDKVDELMSDARRAMVAEEYSRAVQIYTKVLRAPHHDRHAEAQEYLALARERNGQTAHAKAEYQRYLSLYPEGEDAERVRQRLAALLAVDRKRIDTGAGQGVARRDVVRSKHSDWRIRTFFSQYYRHDVNQLNDEDEIVSQSALYSDINLDVRRRGQRFDFSSRLSAGHRNDFLDEAEGPGNDLQISYAYADLADARSGLSGRVGRQSRNSGGILGRFDGLNLGYEAGERVMLNAVLGHPVNSASDGIDSTRRFYGASVNYGPIIDNLELGMYYIQQDIEGIEDRQAVGAEFRFFGVNQSLWGLIDYDTSYREIGSAFLQGSLRFASRLTLHGSVNRRHSPFLSTRNAMIGQPVESFSELLILMTLEEIRQLSLDRAPLTTSYNLGLSHSLTPKLQINVDANQTTIDGTVASGGIAATPEMQYQYYSGNLVVSSLFKEGDVSIIGLRYSTSDSTKVMSLTLDNRFPFGRTFRLNPRLRVDRRRILSDSSYEWLYTPGIRMQFRWHRNFRVDLEAGRQFSRRESSIADSQRDSYFVNLGYQLFF